MQTVLTRIVKNWETTVAGAIAAVVAVLVYYGVVSQEAGSLITAAIVAVGLALTQDSGKSDQDQGLRP